MLGKANTPVRETLVHHSIQGMFAIREGRYKLLMTPDSGGWSEPRPNSPKAKDLPAVQLYDIEEDRAETRNLQAERPDLVARLTRLLLSEIADGSTRAASHRVQP
jgi:hypothetical protein